MAISALTGAALATGGMKLGGQALDFGFGQITSAQAHKRNKEMQDRQFGFNSAESQKSRDWQERMSNTSMQRMMADYKNAGLNPIFATGVNPSVPGGANAQGSPGGSAQQAKGTSFATKSSSNSALQAKKLDIIEDQQEHKQTMELLKQKNKESDKAFTEKANNAMSKSREHIEKWAKDNYWK